MTTTSKDQNITHFEDATAARWLAEKLAPARARVAQEPSPEALDRIRLRVLGVAAPRKSERSIAA